MVKKKTHNFIFTQRKNVHTITVYKIKCKSNCTQYRGIIGKRRRFSHNRGCSLFARATRPSPPR